MVHACYSSLDERDYLTQWKISFIHALFEEADSDGCKCLQRRWIIYAWRSKFKYFPLQSNHFEKDRDIKGFKVRIVRKVFVEVRLTHKF